jgi:hypothetical protein
MANTTIALRQSGATGNLPSLGVLANGELALNYADGILYYKTTANTLGSIQTSTPGGLDTEIQFNDSGSFGGDSGLTFSKSTGYFKAPIIESTNNGNGTNFKVGDDVWLGDINLDNTLSVRGQQNSANAYIVFGSSDASKLGRSGTGALTYTGNFVATGELSTLQSSGDEGGQINFGIPQTNTTLNDGVTIDVYQNKLRIFESGGTARGVYVDLTAAGAGVGTNLIGGTTIAQDAFNKANSANVLAQAAFDKANTDATNISATAGVYGNASHVTVTTLTANGRVSSITNTAIAISADAVTSGTLAVTRGGTGVTTSTGTGAVTLNTSPTLSTPTVDRIDWPAVGYAPPSFTTRSTGTKLNIYPALSGSSVDYAIGIDGATLWSSVPQATNAYYFKWYAGESNIASLDGTGRLTVVTANIVSTNTSTSNTTGALTVLGGVGVKGNVALDGVIFADGTRQTTAGASIGDVLAISIALG